MEHFIFGNLTWDAVPHVWYTIGATASIVLMGLAAAAVITYYKRWKWLWKEWLTSTDPKKIGIMYIVVASAHVLPRGIGRRDDLAAAGNVRRRLAGIS